MAEFGRLVTAMVTPFDDQQQIDWNRLDQLVEHLIVDQQSDSILVAGTTGEAPTLNDEEKKRLFETVVQLAKGRVKVIAGTGSNDTQDSIYVTRMAEAAGADGVLLVAPYYNRPNQEGIYRHFKAIAESTALPIMLYNIPSRCGVNVEVETTLRLAQEFPHITAAKEAHGDLEHISLLVQQAPATLRVYSGDDNWTLPFLSVGAYGIVSVAGHLVGRTIKEMVAAYVAGQPSRALELHQKLYPLCKGLFFAPHRVPNPAAVKHALNVKGIPAGGLRLPMVPVNDAEARYIEALLATLKL